MSISSTVKKIMPYIKTASGYVLHRLSSQAVEMDDGTTLEEKVTALNNLISQKVDTSTVVNNLLTTEAGFVLDARQGKTLNDSISELSSKLSEEELIQDGLSVCTDVHAAVSGGSPKEVTFYRYGKTVNMRLNIHFSASIAQYGTLFRLPSELLPKIPQLFINNNGNVFSINSESGAVTAQQSILSGTWLQISMFYLLA